MTERSEAYFIGRQDCIEGASELDNPYAIGSDAAMDWYDGFCDEESEA